MYLRAGLVSLGLLLLSRVLGLVRESVLAAAFGTTSLGDVAVLMLTLPDWIVGVVANGALAYVLLPYWASQPSAAVQRSQRVVAQVLMGMGALLAALLGLFPTLAQAVLAPGLSGDAQVLATAALGWTALAIVPALLAGLWVTRLQHERDFVGMYGGSVVVNLVLVAGLLLVAQQVADARAIVVLGACLLLAMLLRLAWLAWRMPLALPAAPTLVTGAAGAARLPHAMVWCWAALSAGLPLTLPFAARAMASHAGEGELAAFNYAWKLIELPLTLAIQLVASLAFPAIALALASAASNGNPTVAHADAAADDATANTVRAAFALAFALACAAATALLLGSHALAQALFGWGRMDPDSVAKVAAWASVGALSLLPQAVIAVALAVLAARKRMRPVVLAYAAALCALLALGPWADGNGARLMLLICLVVAGVAALCVWVLGPAARRWLPAGGMLLPGALTVGCYVLVLALGRYPSNALLGLLAAAFGAALVFGCAWLSSADVRRSLHR